MEWEVKRYDDHTLHLINTDIDDLLDEDDVRIAAEEAEKKKQDEDAAARAAVGTSAEDTGETENTGSDPLPSHPSCAETVFSKEMAGTPGVESKNIKSTSMEVEIEAPPVMDVAGQTKPATSKRRYHALCLHLTLPSAAYATMCLREITKQDTSTSFHTSLNALAPGQHPNPVTASEGKGVPCAEKIEKEGAAKVSPPKSAVIKVGASFMK